MERDSAGDVAQMRPECKRMMTAKLKDYRSADFTSGYRFERSISGNPDIDSQHYLRGYRVPGQMKKEDKLAVG